MSKELEFEVKALLNYKSYTRIYRYFNFDHTEPILQCNYYFDTPDLQITAFKAALRIRFVNSKYILTLKYIEGDHKIEVNDFIDEEKFKQMLDGVFVDDGASDVLAKLSELEIELDKIRFINSLTTKRYVAMVEDGSISGNLFLDFNMYGDIADYEVELESNSMKNARELMRYILDKLDIPFVFSDVSKIERAISVTKNKIDTF